MALELEHLQPGFSVLVGPTHLILLTLLLILLLLLPSVTQNLSTAPLPTSLYQAILWDSRGVLPAVIILRSISHGDVVVHGDVVSHGDVVVHRAPVLSTI